MAERDPRVEPKAGDEIQWTEWRICIHHLSHGIVYYKCRHNEANTFGPVVACLIGQYRKWAKGAEVTHAAD